MREPYPHPPRDDIGAERRHCALPGRRPANALVSVLAGSALALRGLRQLSSGTGSAS